MGHLPDLSTQNVEAAEVVAERVRRALPVVPAVFGLEYLPRRAAFARIKAMVDGAAIASAKLA